MRICLLKYSLILLMIFGNVTKPGGSVDYRVFCTTTWPKIDLPFHSFTKKSNIHRRIFNFTIRRLVPLLLGCPFVYSINPKTACLLSERWLCVLNDQKIYMNYIKQYNLAFIRVMVQIWSLGESYIVPFHSPASRLVKRNNVAFTSYHICIIPLIAKLYLYNIFRRI